MTWRICLGRCSNTILAKGLISKLCCSTNGLRRHTTASLTVEETISERSERARVHVQFEVFILISKIVSDEFRGSWIMFCIAHHCPGLGIIRSYSLSPWS